MHLPRVFCSREKKKGKKKKKILTAVSFVIKKKEKRTLSRTFSRLAINSIKEIQQKLEGVWGSVLVPHGSCPGVRAGHAAYRVASCWDWGAGWGRHRWEVAEEPEGPEEVPCPHPDSASLAFGMREGLGPQQASHQGMESRG